MSRNIIATTGSSVGRVVMTGLRSAALFLLLRLRPAVRVLCVLLILCGPAFYGLYFGVPGFPEHLRTPAMIGLVGMPVVSVMGAIGLAYYDRLLQWLAHDRLWLPV